MTKASALAAGFLLFGCVIAVALATNAIELHWRALPVSKLLPYLLLLLTTTIVNAAWEELSFRGWAFSACVHRFGPHPVALSLGLIFGLAHLLNENPSILAILSTSIAGWLLSYLMLSSRHITVPLALHISWNLCQSLLCSKHLWDVSYHGPDWLSGQPYGPEAGLPAIVITTSALLVVLWLHRKQQANNNATS